MPEPGRSLVSYVGGSAEPDEMLQTLHAPVYGIDVPPMSMGDMDMTDEAVIGHVEPRVSPHPINTVIQASKALSDLPNIPVTYVNARGSKVPTFAPFLRRLEADPRVDTHAASSSHVLMLTAPSGTFEIMANVRMTRRGAHRRVTLGRSARRARWEPLCEVVRMEVEICGIAETAGSPISRAYARGD